MPEGTSRVDAMTQRDNSTRRKMTDQVLHQGNPRQMLDILLALDRMLVEVPRHDRLTMRKQNRHLHAAVREHLPRLLKRSRRRS